MMKPVRITNDNFTVFQFWNPRGSFMAIATYSQIVYDNKSCSWWSVQQSKGICKFFANK